MKKFMGIIGIGAAMSAMGYGAYMMMCKKKKTNCPMKTPYTMMGDSVNME